MGLKESNQANKSIQSNTEYDYNTTGIQKNSNDLFESVSQQLQLLHFNIYELD